MRHYRANEDNVPSCPLCRMRIDLLDLVEDRGRRRQRRIQRRIQIIETPAYAAMPPETRPLRSSRERAIRERLVIDAAIESLARRRKKMNRARAA